MVDAAGNAYITGDTAGAFPTTAGAFQRTYRGSSTGSNAFVLELNPAGTAIVAATLLGGGNADVPQRIARDAAGHIFVAGQTTSADFPIKNPAIPRPSIGGGAYLAFVTQLTADMTQLVYSTFLGGTGGYDLGWGLVVDAAGNAWVAGETDSKDFPVKGDVLATKNPSNGKVLGIALTGFVSKLDPSGVLLLSTYLGGSGYEFALAIDMDKQGNLVVAGSSASSDFPGTANGYQPKNGTAQACFLAVLDPGLKNVLAATYLGGSGEIYDGVLDVKVDPNGAIDAVGAIGGQTLHPGKASSTATHGFAVSFSPTLQLLGHLVELTSNGQVNSMATIAAPKPKTSPGAFAPKDDELSDDQIVEEIIAEMVFGGESDADIDFVIAAYQSKGAGGAYDALVFVGYLEPPCDVATSALDYKYTVTGHDANGNLTLDVTVTNTGPTTVVNPSVTVLLDGADFTATQPAFALQNSAGNASIFVGTLDPKSSDPNKPNPGSSVTFHLTAKVTDPGYLAISAADMNSACDCDDWPGEWSSLGTALSDSSFSPPQDPVQVVGDLGGPVDSAENGQANAAAVKAPAGATIPAVFAISTAHDSVSIVKGTASGFGAAQTLSLPAGSGPVRLALLDANGDGVQDIFTLNRTTGTVAVFLSGSGGFTAPPVLSAVGANPRSFTVFAGANGVREWRCCSAVSPRRLLVRSTSSPWTQQAS